MICSILKPTIQKGFNKDIFGFDIETYDNNKKFYCGSVWHKNKNFCKTFFDKDDMINYFKLKRFQNSYISATNLVFDFFGLFHNHKEMKKFTTLFRGSDLIFAKSYIHDNSFHRSRKNNYKPVTFIDTMNFVSLSVEKFGNLLNLPKLSKPKCLGRIPKNNIEKEELIKYNMRDSEISAKGLEFLFNSFYKLGSNIKNTIASTAMSLFKNKYLTDCYFRHDVDDLDIEFLSYYGGRTEAFNRGVIEKYNYYDVNSLYPFVMQKFEYPNPNTLRKVKKNCLDYIYSFEGISKVDVFCPYMEYPLLPLRHETKLLFPYGNFTGVYTHTELRKAVDIGYTIKKVHYTFYFKDNCRPFYNFIQDLYSKRLDLKSRNDPMEYVVKILMNSLYGKFGQKFRDRDNWIPIPDTYEELIKLDIFERKGMYVRIKKEFSEPNSFCIPIWASYVTSYARIHLYDLIRIAHPVYVDTDSIMTKKSMITGDKLGELKLEMSIKKGIIVKPKMYAVNSENKSFVKVKGLGVKLVWDDFKNDLLKNRKMSYTKFAKFKESLRRNIIPNEIIDMCKEFDLEDTKREWMGEFNKDELQYSRPFKMDNQKLFKYYNNPILA